MRAARFPARLSLLRGRAAGQRAACRAAGDLRGLSARQRQDGRAQLSGHSHLGELLGDGGADHRARGGKAGAARRLSQRRRRHPAGPRHRLRHGRQGRGVRGAEAHAMGLRRQSQHGRRHHGGPGLRGVPDRPHERGIRHRRERSVSLHDDPGDRRHAQDRRGRARSDQTYAADLEQGGARDAAGERADAGAAMRRLGRLFRHHRQSRARRRRRHSRAERRHRDPLGDAGDLRRRASADGARGHAARSATSWSS